MFLRIIYGWVDDRISFGVMCTFRRVAFLAAWKKIVPYHDFIRIRTFYHESVRFPYICSLHPTNIHNNSTYDKTLPSELLEYIFSFQTVFVLSFFIQFCFLFQTSSVSSLGFSILTICIIINLQLTEFPIPYVIHYLDAA